MSIKILKFMPKRRKGRCIKMSNYYVVNNNRTCNPGLHHEVHTLEHANQLGITNRIQLGFCVNEVEAVRKAKNYYYDADGCAICCPYAHRG